MDKWSQWYNSLPEHTKIYLKNQPLWHDRDLFYVASVAFAIGVVVGILLG